MKIPVGYAKVPADEIADTLKSAPITPSDGLNYCLTAVAVLTIACLLLFVSIVVKFYKKHTNILSV